jgi:hypothetical protein
MMADELTQWRVAAETCEWVGPITVTANGTPTTAFEVTLTAPGERPSTWSDPLVISGGRGILIGDGTDYELLPGRKYTAWIRYTDDPEVPVYPVGTVRTF